MAINQLNFIVHNPAVEYTFQVTKIMELYVKRSLAKLVSTISEQTALPALHHCPENHPTSLQTHVIN